MLKFMRSNHVGVNSRYDLTAWSEKIAKNGGRCPCNPKTRPECPCPMAASEIKKMGVCACKLFGTSKACENCEMCCKMVFTYID